MIYFWIVWGIDALISLVLIYFFFIGLADGSVSSFNILLWMGILAGIAGVIGGSLLLKHYHHIAAANVILSIFAYPGVFFGIFMLIMIITKPNWQ